MVEIVTFERGILSELKPLIKGALLHPDLRTREKNIQSLDNLIADRFGCDLTSGFIGDNQMFVAYVECNEINIAYVCDLPEEDRKCRESYHRFDL